MEPLRRLSRRAFKPIYILYYKLLFGRRFPFSERLAARAGGTPPSAAADAETYVPQDCFAAGLFKKCVYYFSDPGAWVGPYEPYLTDGGCFVVSTFRSRRADVIARRLGEIYTLREETAITNRKGTWVVRIFTLQPAPASAGTHPSGPRPAAPGSASGE